MSRPHPSSIAAQDAAAQAALDEFTRAIRESIRLRDPENFPNQVAACRDRRMALLYADEIRILLE